MTGPHAYGDRDAVGNPSVSFDPSRNDSKFSFTTDTGTTTVQIYTWPSLDEIDPVPGREEYISLLNVYIESDDPATNYVGFDFTLDLTLTSNESPQRAEMRFTGSVGGYIVNKNPSDVVVYDAGPTAGFSNVEVGGGFYNVRIYPGEPYAGMAIGIAPVPEPAGLALLALPAAALLRRRRREA